MEIICLQENLKKGLNITERIIGKNLTLPILNNILISVEKSSIKLCSTDLEIGINCEISGKIIKQNRGKKIIVFKYKRKTRYKVKKGHRQPFTEVKILKIETN